MASLSVSGAELIFKISTEGLPAAGFVLSTALRKKVALFEDGVLVYSSSKSSKVDMPPHREAEDPVSQSEGVWYYPKHSELVYDVCSPSSKTVLCQIRIENVASREIEKVVSLCEEVGAAIQIYRESIDGKHVVMPFTFLDRWPSMAEVRALFSEVLDRDGYYRIEITHSLDTRDAEFWKDVTAYVGDLARDTRQNAFPVGAPGGCITAMPAKTGRRQDRSTEQDENLIGRNKHMEQRFGLPLSLSTGSAHLGSEVERSYREALVYQELNKNRGRFAQVGSFESLGLYKFAFDQENESIHAFVDSYCNRLVTGKNKGSDLWSTAKSLVRNNFNINETSAQLYINVSTLYYRIRKLEEALGIEIGDAVSRSNLVCAVIVSEVMEAVGALAPDAWCSATR